MAECIGLDLWLATGREASAVVARRGGVDIDFAAFSTRAAQWRSAFASVAGARVALYLEDSAEFAAALFGAWHAGKTMVLPADPLPQTCRRLEAIVDAFAGDLPLARSLPRVQPSAESIDAVTWSPLDRSRIAVQVFTSGSTGEPVAITKSFEQLCSEIDALEAAFGARIGRGMVHASVTHQHMYGLPFRCLWPLASGRPFAAERTLFPEDLLRVLAASADCILVTSPAHLKRLPEHLDWSPARANLRAVFSSAGPLPEAALPLCDRVFGRRPLEIYGSSETGAVAWRQRIASVDQPWQPLPGLQFTIAEDQLNLRAAWLAEPAGQLSADRVAPAGTGFQLLGRGDRIVKIEEKRVSLQAIEQALLSTALVADARVVVLAGERARLGVVAVPNDAGWVVHDGEGRRGLSERLRHALADVVEAVVLPRHWRFPWALPANASGKSTDAALQALFDPRRPQARLIDHGADSAIVRIEVAASSPYFDGHFADAPILPGVVQLDWAILFARELFALPTEFARMDHVKFHDWIGADARIDLQLQRIGSDAVAFKISSATGAHASGKIVFKATV